MSWVESASASFSARHEADEAADAEMVLTQLEEARPLLEQRLGVELSGLAVVLHGSPAQLSLAQPLLPVARLLTAPAARRYLAGSATPQELHLLSPRLLAHRASNVEGSIEALMLTPTALLARVAVARANPGLPLGPRRLTRRRWAWLAEGAAGWLSGQTEQLRPAVARRLREGRTPAFPPSRRDAWLLGGTVIDLLAREHGSAAALGLIREPLPRSPGDALMSAFGGRDVRDTANEWRAHLASWAAGETLRRRRRR